MQGLQKIFSTLGVHRGRTPEQIGESEISIHPFFIYFLLPCESYLEHHYWTGVLNIFFGRGAKKSTNKECVLIWHSHIGSGVRHRGSPGLLNILASMTMFTLYR